MVTQHTTPAPQSTLPARIEVFRAGSHVADDGEVYTFTAADLADIAASYDATWHEAPLCAGHPADNLPAYGWVKNVCAEGDALIIEPHQVEPQFADMVAAGRFKKRSAAFYAPGHPGNPRPGHWALRHVAFLGAQPPAVKGLKDIKFQDAQKGPVFSEALPARHPTQKETDMPENQQPAASSPTAAPAPVANGDAAQIAQLQAQLQAAQEQLNTVAKERDDARAELKAAQDKLAAIDAAKEQQAAAEVAQFAEQMVKEGRLLPKDKVMTIAAMDALRKVAPVEFSEGNTKRTERPLDAYKAQLASRPPIVQFGEYPGMAGGAASVPMSEAELDRAARAHQAKTPNTSYTDALKAVRGGTAY